eukprot:13432900-Alexandrium_andersonii.AAC.1
MRLARTSRTASWRNTLIQCVGCDCGLARLPPAAPVALPWSGAPVRFRRVLLGPAPGGPPARPGAARPCPLP